MPAQNSGNVIGANVEYNPELFESKQIRSVWNEADSKWYFSVADVVQALTDSANVRDYIKKMRKREAALDAN